MKLTQNLGYTSLNVSRLGLSCPSFSQLSHITENEAIALLRNSVESGIQFFDTSNQQLLNIQTLRQNESLLQKALSPFKQNQDYFVATKPPPELMIQPLDSTAIVPSLLVKNCEDSLVTLRTDSIFLYQLDVANSGNNFLSCLEILLQLKTRGKIQHIGLSNVTLPQLKEAMQFTQIMSVQNLCNIYSRNDVTNGLVGFCQENNMTYLPYRPLLGFHRGRLREDPVLIRLTIKYGVSPYLLALLWLLNLNSNVLVIPGMSQMIHLIENLKIHELHRNFNDWTALSHANAV